MKNILKFARISLFKPFNFKITTGETDYFTKLIRELENSNKKSEIKYEEPNV